MLRRAFLGGLGVAFTGGFVKFLSEWYQIPDSEYVESLSLGVLSDTIQIRFVMNEEKREEVVQYLTYERETGEIDAVNRMDARLPRQSIEAPDYPERYNLVLLREEQEELENIRLDFGL